MKEKELVSIVIPVYNVEKYLDRCMESVLNQTYNNIEILLIDDGSTDNSGKMCDKYSKIDKRIRVFHKENGGLSSARNVGLNNFKGQYIYFLDSDDTIVNNCIELMHKEIVDKKCDIVISPYINIKNGKKIEYFKTAESKIMEVEEALKEMLYANLYNVSACGKLYKKSVVKNIEFPFGMLCEDNGTTYKFIMNSNKVYYLNKTLYNYYINANSIMHGSFNFKKYDLITLTDIMCNDITKVYKSLDDICFRRKVYARLSFLRQALQNKENRKNPTIRCCKLFITGNFKKIMLSKSIQRRDKIATLLLMLGNGVYSFSWRLYEKTR